MSAASPVFAKRIIQFSFVAANPLDGWPLKSDGMGQNAGNVVTAVGPTLTQRESRFGLTPSLPVSGMFQGWVRAGRDHIEEADDHISNVLPTPTALHPD